MDKAQSITRFARSRGVEPQTVSRYIARHAGEFEGLTRKVGKEVLLSETAMDLLDEVYPQPRPVEVIEDTESRRKLLQMQELVIQLQGKIVEQTQALAAAETSRLLLEDRERQLQAAQDRLDAQSSRITDLERDSEELRARCAALAEEKARRDHASLWQRIFQTW